MGRDPRDPSRPFDPGVVARASRLAGRYAVVMAPEENGAFYLGRTIEMPFVMADGKTPVACFKRVMAATTFAAAALQDCGGTPPEPVFAGV